MIQDLEKMKQEIPIKALAQELGIETRHNSAKCFNSIGHGRGDKNRSLSFKISNKDNYFKCFGCNIGGSVIDLEMLVTGKDKKTAIQDLASRYGFSKSTAGQVIQKVKYIETPEPVRTIPENANNFAIYEALESFCGGSGGIGQETLKYLTGVHRGLSEDIIKRFRIFSISDYKKTNEFLKNTFPLEQLLKSGLLNEKNEKHNLTFWKQTIIIPFIKQGRIITLRARYFFNGSADTDGAKIRGITGHTTKIFFNEEIIGKLEQGRKIFITEGEFDCMVLMQNKYNAIGVLGVENISDNMIEQLKGLNVVLSFDNDNAGIEAMQNVAKRFLVKGQKVKIKQLPTGTKDVTEYFINLKPQLV